MISYQINYFDGDTLAARRGEPVWRPITAWVDGCGGGDTCALDAFVERNQPFKVLGWRQWNQLCGNPREMYRKKRAV